MLPCECLFLSVLENLTSRFFIETRKSSKYCTKKFLTHENFRSSIEIRLVMLHVEICDRKMFMYKRFWKKNLMFTLTRKSIHRHEESCSLWSLFIYFFFYLGFLSRTITVHRTAGEGGGYSFNSSLPLPPALKTLRH